MNRPTQTDRREREILEKALEALRHTTGLNARTGNADPLLGNKDGWWYRPDALIIIEGQGRGVQLRFAAEVVLTNNRETIAQVRAHWAKNAQPPLILVLPHMNQQLADYCRELGLFFIDTAGNAFIDEPGMYVYVTGQKRPEHALAIKPGRIDNPAALKVVFTILCRPDLLQKTYRDLAHTARVALGTVGPVIKELEINKHVATFGTAMVRRRLLNPERLLKQWVELYPVTLRPKLRPRRFHLQDFDKIGAVNLEKYGAYWGGEIAAAHETNYLVPETAVIYTRQDPTAFIRDHRLRADVNGNIEILDVFWNPDEIPHKPQTVPPLLTYADLVTTTDGRNIETARILYAEYITPHLHTKN